MGIIARIKGWFGTLFNSKARDDFQVKDITSDEVRTAIDRCVKIYRGDPDWLSESQNIKTINFAKSLCEETARLATLAIGIKVDGSARAEWLQQQIEKLYFNLRQLQEYGLAFGTIAMKYSGESVDIFTPSDFFVTDQKDGKITGAVFCNRDESQDGKKHYTRLEYHRFLDDGAYAISNRCYVGEAKNDLGQHIDIEKTPWAGLAEETVIQGIERPLFGVLKTPQANNVDMYSPLTLPIFYNAIEELKDLDIAYSRNAKEIMDSRRIVLLDADRLMPSGRPVYNNQAGIDKAREDMGLPDMVKNVFGDGQQTFYQEINPTLNTDVRLAGINSLLSQIGYKAGFSNGYFVFNQKTGNVTATQVEADQQRTIQFIKDCRDRLESCMDDLIYSMDKFADLYGYAPVGAYEVTYDFGDITYNREEDRATWWGYVVQGKVPFWYYLVKFEGFTEEEAKALEQAAQPKEPTLFGKEE